MPRCNALQPRACTSRDKSCGRAIFCGVDNACHCMTIDHHPDLKVVFFLLDLLLFVHAFEERAGARRGCWWQHHEWQVHSLHSEPHCGVIYLCVQGERAACDQSIFRRLQLQVFDGGEPGLRLPCQWNTATSLQTFIWKCDSFAGWNKELMQRDYVLAPAATATPVTCRLGGQSGLA